MTPPAAADGILGAREIGRREWNWDFIDEDSKFITVGPLLTQPEKGSNEDVSGEVEAVKEIKLARDAGRKARCRV